MKKKPNVLFVFADQWRSDAFGYRGNIDIKTPHIDRFAESAISVPNAISSCPLCSPYRASMLTGTYPLHNGVFMNDVTLNPELTGIGTAFKGAGYQTGYIGKWHVHGKGRSSYIPPDNRCGFDYWRGMECTHDYMNSNYYADNDKEMRRWDGYDADAQTDDLIRYLSDDVNPDAPFCAFLSWGPPHAPPPFAVDSPYDQFPDDLSGLYREDELHLRGNVPSEDRERAQLLLSGYYSHCTALDRNFGKLVRYLENTGLMDNTILVFTSDHGDSLGSQGLYKKQNPFRESIRVPFLIHLPGHESRSVEDLVLAPEDIMPTLLSLCGIDVPKEVDGVDCSKNILGDGGLKKNSEVFALYIACGQWSRDKNGGVYNIPGREYRGLKTDRYSYVISREGPWLLFDDRDDPEQRVNLVDAEPFGEVRRELHAILMDKLAKRGDTFEAGEYYPIQWGYEIGEDLAVIFEE